MTNERVCRGAAFDVDSAILNKRNAISGRDSLILYVQFVEAELFLRGVGNSLANEECVARRLTIGIKIGERYGAFSIAESD